jgi:hypothetical protein
MCHEASPVDGENWVNYSSRHRTETHLRSSTKDPIATSASAVETARSSSRRTSVGLEKKASFSRLPVVSCRLSIRAERRCSSPTPRLFVCFHPGQSSARTAASMILSEILAMLPLAFLRGSGFRDCFDFGGADPSFADKAFEVASQTTAE